MIDLIRKGIWKDELGRQFELKGVNKNRSRSII